MVDKNRIGFVDDDDYEEEQSVEVGTVDTVVVPFDLNEELIGVVNKLIDILKEYKGTILGVTITVDKNGNYSAKLNY